MKKTYQRHELESNSISDSANKLLRLRIPESLVGKRVLDIGCNEGYFCNVAAKRGAVEVVGLDFSKDAIDFASTRYSEHNIKWVNQSWNNLPEGTFDIILWCSAMHYDLDPARTIHEISRRLAVNGIFILECGVAPGAAKEMVPVQRQGDTRWYPTSEFLTSVLLKPFSFRQVAAPEVTPGDPIPRSVYHCVRRLPVVLLIRGETHHGKSTVARSLSASATKIIDTDTLIYRIASSDYCHNDLQGYVQKNYNPNDLTKLYYGIDQHGHTGEYVKILTAAVADSDGTVILEGLITDIQAEKITAELNRRAIVWDVNRRWVDKGVVEE